MLIIETGHNDAIRLGKNIQEGLSISLGHFEDSNYVSDAIDVLDKSTAMRIVEHLKNEFNI